MQGSIEQKEQKEASVDSADQGLFESKGSLGFQNMEDKLMHSVMDSDESLVKEAKLLSSAMSNNISSFSADKMLAAMITDFKLAKSIYGKSLIELSTGYSQEQIEKSIRFPEFQRELKKRLDSCFRALSAKKLITKNNVISEKGIELAALLAFNEELEKLKKNSSFYGTKFNKKKRQYGEKAAIRQLKNTDSYRNLAVRQSLKLAIRRGHKQIEPPDLKAFERKGKTRIYIAFALDASGSMKGDKLDNCKKAGIALAYKAIQENDMVSLIVFNKDVKTALKPSKDFGMLLKSIVSIRASGETDIAAAISKAIAIFSGIPKDSTKHIILITDSLPTVGIDPFKETLDKVAEAAQNSISVSIVGLGLEKKPESLARKIAEIGRGRLYIMEKSNDVDNIVLEDYYRL